MSDAILTERRGRVLVITMNRPEAKNAINGDLANGLFAAVGELNEDSGLTAGVLTGAGGAFCSGMDLKAFAKGEDIGPIQQFFAAGAEKPLIGAIEGFALAGGLEIALSCDLLVAAEGAKLGIPEVKVGLFAAGMGLMRLPARVGYGKAMEMAVTGDPITAEEGHAFGLISRLAEPGTAVDVAIELAERIAKNAPLGVAASKKIIRATQGNTEDEMMAIQADMYIPVFTSNDAKEGPAAFAEKREPNWTGT
ncbi:MAG: crotonase/enoyl-CoA hydratase family protein [Acidimicrobiales bacterium]|nr:crotonase/enoyl-CoA hydratase family protein [Acidimicrobiales bacterium]